MDPKKMECLNKAVLEYVVAAKKPFSEIEIHFFRKMLFVADPNYICQSKQEKVWRKK